MAPKNKPNAFLYFMLEWKREQERQGRKFPNGLKDVQIDPDCNEQWKNLSNAEKAIYKEREKTEKNKPIEKKKKTTLGEDLSEVEQAQIRKQEFEEQMNIQIRETIQRAKDNKQLLTTEFFVIHVNFFYYRALDHNEPDYHPAEMAVIKFSISEGVIDTFSIIINEPIALGYAREAKENSAASHEIPVEPSFGESNYEVIYKELVKVLRSGRSNSLPPVYVTKEARDPVQSLLKRACRAYGLADDYINLYSFESLFTRIVNAIASDIDGKEYPDILASIEIKKDPYAYKLGLGCEYHQSIQSGELYCSQSIAKRWIFTLFDHCCHHVHIKKIPGKHEPPAKPTAIHSLESSLYSLNLNDSRSTISMTNVSENHRERVSARTFTDEEKRRQESKPVEFIDHSKKPITVPDRPQQRPLRAPYTKSAAQFLKEAEESSIDLNSEDSFPTIGSSRSSVRSLASIARDYSNALKK